MLPTVVHEGCVAVYSRRIADRVRGKLSRTSMGEDGRCWTAPTAIGPKKLGWIAAGSEREVWVGKLVEGSTRGGPSMISAPVRGVCTWERRGGRHDGYVDEGLMRCAVEGRTRATKRGNENPVPA